jgi:hypothetical protein
MFKFVPNCPSYQIFENLSIVQIASKVIKETIEHSIANNLVHMSQFSP